MGYFGYLYLIEANMKDDDEVAITTSVYKGGTDPKPFFSWVAGNRAASGPSYGSDTIYCSNTLEMMQPYPVTEEQRLGSKLPHLFNGILIDASFVPELSEEETVCHVILPPRFLPRKDCKPLIQPHLPYVRLNDQRIILTWPVAGNFNIRFCATLLDSADEMETIILGDVMRPLQDRKLRLKPQLNLNFINFNFPFS